VSTRRPLMSHEARCCGTTFTADSIERAVEMHAEYHNYQYSVGRRAERVEVREVEVTVEDVWEGDLIRLAPATDTRPALFSKVTSVEHNNSGTKVHFVKIRTEDGDELLLNPRGTRTVRVTFLTRRAAA
jgi:hypothetical protein